MTNKSQYLKQKSCKMKFDVPISYSTRHLMSIVKVALDKISKCFEISTLLLKLLFVLNRCCICCSIYILYCYGLNWLIVQKKRKSKTKY